jgi:predicted dehydrogenase
MAGDLPQARVRFGLIGTGTMGSLHARVISESTRADLAWVSDPDSEVGQLVADRHDSTWLAEPNLSSVDAVIIAAATQFHHELAMQVIHAGKPLLVEKPLADTLDHATEIVEASTAAGLPLMCGFLERYNPAILTAMEFVENPIHVAASRHSPYVPRIRTGVASDLLIHDLDVLLRVFGEHPLKAEGHLGFFHPDSDPGSEDMADAIVDFPSGGIGTATASRTSQRKVRTLTITELDRQIDLDLVRQDITIYRHVGNAPVEDSGLGYSQQTVIDIPVIRHQREPLATQLNRFVDIIAGSLDAEAERSTLLPPHELLEVVRHSADRAQPPA